MKNSVYKNSSKLKTNIFFLEKLLVTSLALFLLCFLNACTSDNEEELFEEETCDLSSISYDLKVQPILSQYCFACHSTQASSNSGAGIDLMDFDQLKIQVNNGSLLGSIKHDSNFSPMPKGGAKLSECEIETIQAWINAGAPQD
ncbi:c-type cytochrome [Xanthovirga aplysinae]|uniref:c-type cytochrome n=1 Tax=Xanthovirga aplysinae TaxID=2529853 RepID=UPI0012BC83EC|nr:cytochrome c [Xanthovirga aplysinae]MTI31869.1 hypothetical protein [Xanthovirga aplysinae]